MCKFVTFDYCGRGAMFMCGVQPNGDLCETKPLKIKFNLKVAHPLELPSLRSLSAIVELLV